MDSSTPNFLPSLLGLLPDLGPVTLRKEVGRVGLFFQDRLFGLVSAGQFWMRTDPEVCPVTGKPLPASVQMLADRGEYFMPVPEHVLKDKKTLHRWVHWALSV